MSAKRIRDLPVASSVIGTDLIEIEQGGTSKQAQASLIGTGSGGAPVDAHYLVATSSPDIANEVNLGGMNSGILKSSVSAGVAVITPTQMPYTVNVKDAPYNAVGNGVADDSAAIQAAITAVWNAGGGTIFFPRGVYLCNGAFDGTTNSVLKIPFNAQANPPLSIALIGEVGAPWFSGSAAAITSGTIIKCTKTGSGTRPAILAGAAWSNSPSVTDFNYTYLYIENMTFQTYDDPSINGLQLGTTIGVQLKNIRVDTHPQGGSGITQPSHGTTAIVMPKVNDGPLNRCDNVVVAGFDSGFIIGEHFHGPWLMAAQCNIGFIFEGVNEGSTANLGSFWCPVVIEFDGVHPADLYLDTERATSGWQTHVREVNDSSNFGKGIIRYGIVQAGVGPTGPISTNGGANLRMIDLNNANKVRVTSITSSATPTINTDTCDAVTITALAAAITSMTTNLSGSPKNFEKLIIRIKDNGTARAITWGASFVSSQATLPTTTVISKVTTVGLIWDAVKGKWVCIAVDQEP